MRILKTIILIFKICLFGNILSADTISWSEVLDQPKFNVIFLRHTLAPGYGDPSEFDISDCKTQRNLNQEGRDQAISIGIRLKMEGFCSIKYTERVVSLHRDSNSYGYR